MTEQQIFKDFSRYLVKEPVFVGEYYQVKIENDYYVTRKLYNGGEYFAVAESIWHPNDYACIPSTFVPFSMVFTSNDIGEVLKELQSSSPEDIDYYAKQIKWWMDSHNILL